MTTTPTITLNSWTARNGQTRRYVNGWEPLVGLEVTRYKTGNISGASVNGEGISNAAAGRLLGIKVWIDDADVVHVDHWRDEHCSLTPAAIIAAVKADLGIEG